MSTFGGKLREYDAISLDRFDGINLRSTTYFLSHFHKDHTVGLSSEKLAENLRNGNGLRFLYLSDVTRLLLLADPDFAHLDKYIKTLQVNEPTVINVPDVCGIENTAVTVTCLPAHHCLGSVMFLLESKNSRVLYTGDFRWAIGETAKHPALHEGHGPKLLDALYIDTTFCFPEAYYIPSHEDCVSAVVDLCKEWIYKSPDHIVWLMSSVKYGHEYLIADVANHLNKKVHMPASRQQLYKDIDDFGDVFCGTDTSQIHTCYPPHCSRVHQAQTSDLLRVIRPSTMWFIHNQNAHNSVVKTKRMTRVCYCFHSSYGEVKDLVTYLKPKRVYPNVVPPSHKDSNQVQMTLNSFLDKTPVQTTPVKTLGKLCQQATSLLKSSQSLTESNDLCFGTPEKTVSPQTKTSSTCLNNAEQSSSLTTICSSGSSYVCSEIRGNNWSDLDDSQNITTNGPKIDEIIDEKDVIGYLSGDSDDDDYTQIFESVGGKFYGRYELMKKCSRSPGKRKLESLTDNSEGQKISTDMPEICDRLTHKNVDTFIEETSVRCTMNELVNEVCRATEPCTSKDLLLNQSAVFGHKTHDELVTHEYANNSVKSKKSNESDNEMDMSTQKNSKTSSNTSKSIMKTTSQTRNENRRIVNKDTLLNDDSSVRANCDSNSYVSVNRDITLTPSHGNRQIHNVSSENHFVHRGDGIKHDVKDKSDVVKSKDTQDNKKVNFKDCGIKLNGDVNGDIMSNMEITEITDMNDIFDNDIEVIDLNAMPDKPKECVNIIETSSEEDSGKISAGLLMDCDEISSSSENDTIDQPNTRLNGVMMHKTTAIIVLTSSESEDDEKPTKKKVRRISPKSKIKSTPPQTNKKPSSKVSISSASETASQVTLSSMSSNDILRGVEREIDRQEQTRLWCESITSQSRPKKEVKVSQPTDECSSGFVDLTQDSDSDCIAYV